MLTPVRAGLTYLLHAVWFSLLIASLPIHAIGQTADDAPNAVSPLPPSTQPSNAPLTEVNLKHLGTIKLETPTPPSPAVRDIFDWDIDDQGRIGFYRMDGGGWDTTFVLVEPTGRVVTEIPLDLGKKELVSTTVRCLTEDRWLIFANEIHAPHNTKMWVATANSPGVTFLADLDGIEPEALAADRNGGFVVYRPEFQQQSGYAQVLKYGRLIAYDGHGNERWRTPDEMELPDGRWPFSAAIAVTTEGKLVLYEANSGNLFVFTPDGQFSTTIRSGAGWSCTATSKDVFADADGGVLITSRYGSQPGKRVRLDDGDPSTSNVLNIAARTFNRRQSLWKQYGYLQSEIKPQFPDGRPVGRTRGARVADDGHVWICDGESFLRLDENDIVDCIIGEGPTNEVLRKIGGRRIDQQGRTFLTSPQTGSVHVFDETGKQVEVIPPDPEAVRKFGLDGLRRSTMPQPQGGRSWKISGRELTLLGGKYVETTVSFDHSIDAAGIGPDGGIAVILSELSASKTSDYTVNLYDKDGESIRSFPISVEGRPDQLTYDGKNIVFGTWYGKYLYIFDAQGGQPRKIVPQGSGADAPEWREGWYPFFSKNYRELWILHIQTRIIERYEAPR